jgi:arylsulfatase A-like enzyme
MAWPEGFAGGQECDEIFSWADVVPTLCDACGAAMPAEHTLDGVSVLPALRGQADWPRQVAYHEMGWSRSVIKGRWQYIATRYPKWAIEDLKSDDPDVEIGIGQPFDKLNAPLKPGYFDADQLYDLETDPDEEWNLIDDPARADVIEDLRKELWSILATLPRPFPEEPSEFRQSDRYRELLEARKAEMAAIEHYPPGHAPHIWFANLRDPCVGA